MKTYYRTPEGEKIETEILAYLPNKNGLCDVVHFLKNNPSNGVLLTHCITSSNNIFITN